MYFGAGTKHLLPGRREKAARARRQMADGRNCPVEPLPAKKVFIKKNPEIPSLRPEQYKLDDFGDEYWSHWPAARQNNNSPWLRADAVRQIQRETSCVSDKQFQQLLRDIEEGVELGCTGDARLNTECKNNASAGEHGERLLDQMATWLKSGICSGPFTKEKLEQIFPGGWTVNPLQCAEKPDGKVSLVHTAPAHLPAGQTHRGYVQPALQGAPAARHPACRQRRH